MFKYEKIKEKKEKKEIFKKVYFIKNKIYIITIVY